MVEIAAQLAHLACAERAGELVEATKQEEFSVPEESKNFSFHQKEEKVRTAEQDAWWQPCGLLHLADKLLMPGTLAPPHPDKMCCGHAKMSEQGGEVRRTERKWKSLSKQEREAFLAQAHENHEKNDFTKEHMREARKEIIKRNQE